jgi:tetratricopeptide (TPR) repeat protein
MTEIALRTYNQEIKDLIDHGHYEEAIAHCQHILETFPRHIETYRLLGKAFLEQSRHGDAADVFQRVLSAMPEDWLSHVAMAIVREDESNLDMAIWHMERAYEVNPSNPTVQQEVRRLRGRRDGVEPPKLRLTRSALARMYIKGGLYGQAIAEIRNALTEDPDRPDLQTLMASALYDSGSIQEAADICSTLLQKLPYCLEANRILGLVLWASEKKEDAEKLFQRIESLDPYVDLDILKKEKRIAEHPAQAITLSRLEYEGQEKTVRTKQPSWASSLGLKIEEPQQQQAIPDWLAAATQAPSPIPSTAPAPGPAASAPSWIDEAAAAVSASTGGAAAPNFPFGMPSSTPAEPPTPIARTATGELPDWIQAQAATNEPSREPEPARQIPSWISAAPMPSEPEPAPPSTASTLPDWIKTASLPPETPREEISGIPDWLSTPPPPSVEALPSTSLPEWARPETKTGPLEVEANNIPDWLSSSQPTSVGAEPAQEWLEHTTPTVPAKESIPDWMKGVTPAEPAADVQPSTEEVPEWLRESAPQTSKPVEIVPDWMRGETPAAPAAKPAHPPPPAVPADEIPEWMKPEPGEMAVTPPSKPVLGLRSEPAEPAPRAAVEPPEPSAVPEVSLPDWLSAGPAAPAPATQVPAAPPSTQSAEEPAEAVPAESLPDWLTAAAPKSELPQKGPAFAAPSAIEQAVKPAAEIHPAPEPEEIEQAPQESAPEIAMPDWLKAVPASSAPAPAPVENAEQPAEIVPEANLPDWVKGGPQASGPAAAVEKPAEIIPEANLPDWLKGGPQAPAPAAAFEAPPAVLSREAAPAAAAPAREDEGITEPSVPSEPGPAHVTPTAAGEGVDLPDWLVAQLEGKPKVTAAAPAAEQPNAPLPDWLKGPAPGSAAPAVVDWEKAASQPVPAAPVDATRPATGIYTTPTQKPAGGSAEIPSWLDKSKPSGSDTVARWLDRRLKTSTLSSLDEAVIKGGAKPPGSTSSERPGKPSTTQLPTWLDSQKPGGSDTVVRWMDKRETGSLRKPVTASFAAVSKGTAPVPEEKTPPAAPVAQERPSVAPAPGSEDTVASKRAAQPAPAAEAAQPPPAAKTPAPSVIQPAAAAVRPPAAEPPSAPVRTPAEEEEDGAFVPPPEWLKKALGSAVAEVPPIPKKQTGGLTPGTATASLTPVHRKPVEAPRAVHPVEEPAPVTAAKPGPWVPIAQAPPAAHPSVPAVAPVPVTAAEKAEARPKKTARKKPRKLSDIELEALLREARVYLETDLQKAAEAYQKVIEDPASAEAVVGDLTTYLEQDPAPPQLWNLLGDACSRVGRLQDAYRAYAEALRRM